MPPQYPQNPQITDMDREAAKILRRMLQAQARLDELSKTNVPQGYALIRETPDGGKIYRKPDGQLTFTSSGYGTNNQAEIQRMIQGMAPGQARRAETNKQIVEQDGVRGAAASAIKGLPFIGEYFDEAVGMMTGDPRTTAALRETTNAYQEQRPLETFGLQMGLGTAATLPLVPFQAVGNALKAAPTMGRAMLGGLGIGAAAGATEGAVSGFGAGEGTAQQRLPSAQTGAVIGGTLGGALGAAAAPIEAGVRSVMQNWLKSVPPNVLEAPELPDGAVRFGAGANASPNMAAPDLSALKQQGFDVDAPLYHGTGANFEKFNTSGSGTLGPGVYLTRSKDMADQYGNVEGGRVIPVYVRKDRIATQDDYFDLLGQPGDVIAAEMKSRGFEGVEYKYAGGKSETVIFDPRNLVRGDRGAGANAPGAAAAPRTAKAPPATLQDAEKILTDFRVARELSDEQLTPVADAINTEMRRLQNKTVEVNGERIPYSNTSEGYERVMKLNGLLMNAFRDETGEIDIAKAMQFAERNDPDRAMRVEAGRAVNDLQDGVRPSKPRSGPPGVKLLAGMSGNAEAIGAGAGAVFAPDVDGDGEVSFGERAGAAITGALGGRLFGGRGSGGQPSNVDAQGFGGGSVSMRSYAQAAPEELDEWYKSEVEQVAKSSTKTTLRLKSSPETQEGTLRKLNDVHINFENDGVGLAVDMTFRGGHSAKYTAIPKDVAAATRVFAKSLAAINVYVRKNNPTYITFYGATPAHTKLYQKLMERANIQGYTPIKDVGSTSYMNKTPTGEVISSVAPRPFERFMLIKDEELAKFKARHPNALTSFAYQSVGPDGAPIVGVSKNYADRTPIR